MIGLIFLCAVVGVHDGDTLRCQDGTRVRLQAIDAPELGKCRKGRICAPGEAKASKASLTRLAFGQTIRCEKTGTSYERITAYCSANSVDLSCAMYKGGYAIRLEKYDRQKRLCAR